MFLFLFSVYIFKSSQLNLAKREGGEFLGNTAFDKDSYSRKSTTVIGKHDQNIFDF